MILNELFNKIECNYDMLNDCYWGIKELYDMGDITDIDDIEWYLENYVTEEDEMTLGCINLCKKIEDRDFVKRLFNI